MKQIMIWMILAVGLSVGACHQTTVGYLLTENASYDPDTMYIRKTLDPELDAVRIENKAPWVFIMKQSKNGVVENAPKPIHISFMNSQPIFAIASGDIEPDNCIVHALEYNFALGYEQ